MAHEFIEAVAEWVLEFILEEQGENIFSNALELQEKEYTSKELADSVGFDWYLVTLRGRDEVICLITDKKPDDDDIIQFELTRKTDSTLAGKFCSIENAA